MRINRLSSAVLALSVSLGALTAAGGQALAQERAEANPPSAPPAVQPLPESQRVEAPPLEPAKPAPEQSAPATPPAAAAAPQPAPAVAVAPAATDPLLTTIKERLPKAQVSGSVEKDHLAALIAFYNRGNGPLWIADGSFNGRAEQAIATLRSADEWGLEAKAFAVPDAPAKGAAETQADAEIKLGLAVLKYARHASGGRVDPTKLSKYMDVKPRIAEPAEVLLALAGSSDAAAVLTGLNPKHPQFVALKKALAALRAPVAAPVAPEPAKAAPPAVRLPDGPALKPGAKHEHIALLRDRLAMPPDQAGQERAYDTRLVAAVKAFQEASNLDPNGVLNARTRKALNGDVAEVKAAARPSPSKDIERVVLSMERWRWAPPEFGEFYVWDNIPEFTMRVVKANDTLHKEKIIVGKTNTQTPIFSARMQFIVFHPEWGVPDSIKTKEILPYLRRPAQDGGFFGLGGSGISDTRVLQRHNLRVSMNGKPVDAGQIDWNTVDIRQFQFIQPSGGANVLGVVKFRFPNKHDVYMHDTPQRELFNAKVRTFSHGCMRVHKPQRLAEVLLAEDQGMSAAQVAALIAKPTGSSYEITLKKQIPVHVTYMTAVVGEDGKLETFPDIYGHDGRLTLALSGKQTEFVDPEEIAERPEALARQAQMPNKRKGPPAKQDGPASFLSALFGN